MAAYADVAVLLVDAKEGLRDNTRRHILMLSLLGVQRLAIVINKIDLVDYNEATFNRLKDQVVKMQNQHGMNPDTVIPASACKGENLTGSSQNMSWYGGVPLFDFLKLTAPIVVIISACQKSDRTIAHHIAFKSGVIGANRNFNEITQMSFTATSPIERANSFGVFFRLVAGGMGI